MVPTSGEVGRAYDEYKHHVIYGKNVMSAQMLEVSLVGVGAVLRSKEVCGQWSKD